MPREPACVHEDAPEISSTQRALASAAEPPAMPVVVVAVAVIHLFINNQKLKTYKIRTFLDAGLCLENKIRRKI